MSHHGVCYDNNKKFVFFYQIVLCFVSVHNIMYHNIITSSHSLVGLVATKSHACYLLGGTG